MLLAIDTATDMIGLAVSDGERILAEQVWAAPRHATLELAPETGRLLRRIGVPEERLEGLALTIGPGSYSGLRIGLAFAKGLALGRGLKIVAVPTLDVLALGQPSRSEPMLALLSAGRGRWSAAWYKWSKRKWKIDGPIRLLDAQELTAALDRPTYVCGEMGTETRKALAAQEHAVLAPPEFCLRRPAVLAQIGWERLRTRKATDPVALVPLYGSTADGGRA
jgi:tRNA threonylcarbamoyladenosine biosynthesis protein TsaB